MKLFIDECLSNELAKMAIERGYTGSTSVTWRKRAGTKDWNLVPIVVQGDFTLVTKNSIDFRGHPDKPGEKGLYKDVEIHPGLICLNGPYGMDLDLQCELFSIALDELETLNRDLTNKCLEVTLPDDGDEIVAYVYELPNP